MGAVNNILAVGALNNKKEDNQQKRNREGNKITFSFLMSCFSFVFRLFIYFFFRVVEKETVRSLSAREEGIVVLVVVELAYRERYLRWNLESGRSRRCHSDGPLVRTWQDRLSKWEAKYLQSTLRFCFLYFFVFEVWKVNWLWRCAGHRKSDWIWYKV